MAVLIFKPTAACNANCRYCEASNNRHTSTMSVEMLGLLMQRIDEYLTDRPEERVALTWHGGEPLLLGPDYFEKAWELQNRHCPRTGSRIEHLIQSNATLFDERFVPAFRKLKIRQVGTSYEPLPGIRGPGKGTEPRDSESYNRQFLRGTACMERHGILWGMIYTVHRQSLEDPLRLYHFLINLTGGNLNFNPVCFGDETENDLAITASEYTEFLGTVFKAWWPQHEVYAGVQPFGRFLQDLSHGGCSGSCCYSGRCSHGWLGIGPDGVASHCGRTLDWSRQQYGNIVTHSMADLLNHEKREVFRERIGHLQETECSGCRFWNMCHGGCPLDAHLAGGDYQHRWKWCESVKGLMERYMEPITGMRYESR